MTKQAVECWACLDFGDRPGLGPCPECRPDSYAEHVLGQMACQEPTTKGVRDV